MANKTGTKKLDKKLDKKIHIEHDTNDNKFSAPTSIRSVSRFSERVKGIAVVVLYALFAGLSIYHIQSFAINNGSALGDSSAMFYLIAAVIFAMAGMSINAFYIYYSSKVQSKMTTHRMCRHLISAGVPLIGLILLMLGVFGTVDADKVNSGTNIFLYISAAGMAISGGWAFIENFIQRKRFPRAFKISLFLAPGILVALVGLVLLSTQTSSPVINDKTQQWGTLIFPGLVLIAGCVLTLLGAALVNRTSDYENKLKKLIKYGYVTHILVTSIILTCFLFTKVDFSILFKNTTGVIVLIVQVIATVAIITYIGIYSRLKKISKANPIHNKVLLLAYIAFVNVLGILVIFETPKAFETTPGVWDPSTVSTYSYMFLGLSALQTTIVALVAAFMAFVTIEFKGATVFFMGMFQVVLIVLLVSVIYVERDVQSITDFMGRFVVLLIYASVMVIYLLFELYWIIHLFLGEKSDKREIARAKEALAKKEKEQKEIEEEVLNA